MPNKLLMKLLIYIQTPSACPQDSGNSIMHTVFNLNTVWIMYHMPSKFWMKLLIHFQTSKQHRLGMMWLIIHAGIKVSQDLGFVIFTNCFRPQACTGEHLSDTGMWYTILSPAIPTVCLEVMSENFALLRHRWRHHHKIFVFDLICYVHWNSVTKFELSFNFTTIHYGYQTRSQAI